MPKGKALATVVKTDVVMMAVGRQANTDGIGLDKVGVKIGKWP